MIMIYKLLQQEMCIIFISKINNVQITFSSIVSEIYSFPAEIIIMGLNALRYIG